MTRAIIIHASERDLRPLLGRSCLERVAQAARQTEGVAAVVALGELESTPLAAACAALALPLHPANQRDPLAAFAGLARTLGCDHVAQLSSDQALSDPGLIADLFRLVETSGADWGCNDAPATFPDGLDVHVFTRALIARAAVEAGGAHARAGVDVFARDHRALRTARLVGPGGAVARWRWRVRSEDDAGRLARLLTRHGRNEAPCGWRELAEICDAAPELMADTPSDHGAERRFTTRAPAGCAVSAVA